ncbi:ANP1/MMN9/VAN1 family protein NDAI_0B01250 [Naumovozyma dairenensis CBS 421]|uniref:Mannan polymerase II complex ANP1 subunit n=1 Tax=Naumovozyma dairenensis (strain ATCC 10597 / BCRC 20456 / CBS 421 / NBRC 0211 / NRRL Y-12639) TaxID=1071378 RepID=G0W5U8_NAUDC|nr:hypothetical protein NDAI_0B01250 [Naumovozyma dairenensis CBS 421]CCD23159.1 hypothetical protein NDAI_0B01250 [Naumovozyma dairenensis CBS 421]
MKASISINGYEVDTRIPLSICAIFLFLNKLLHSWIIDEFTRNEHRIPDFQDIPSVEFYDMSNYQGHKDGWNQNNRILICVPLKDASNALPLFFKTLEKMTYPHELIDLSFLVSDSSDNTMYNLLNMLKRLQIDGGTSGKFGNIEIYEKDFGQVIGQGFSDRHGFAAQGPRRKLMGKARNWLNTVAIKPYHSWVYWRDVDVEIIPETILEDLMHHDKDVIVPNVWRPLPDWLGNIQPYDLNSWKESEAGLALSNSLGEDAVIVEGYPEYATWRSHLAYMRDPNGDPEREMELDGVGGVSILSKANVFRSGSHFPAFSFKKHAETEAFGKLSKHMNFTVIGLPNYVVWHIYEPSKEDLQYMAKLEEKERLKRNDPDEREIYEEKWDDKFKYEVTDWQTEKRSILLESKIKPETEKPIDWSDNSVDDDNVPFLDLDLGSEPFRADIMHL